MNTFEEKILKYKTKTLMYSYELLAASKDIGVYVHSEKYQAPLTPRVSLINIMCNQSRPLLAHQFSTEFLIQT
jgi:hypothetical protein